MDPSAIVGILLGAGLLALIVAVAVRMAKKRPASAVIDAPEPDEAQEPSRAPPQGAMQRPGRADRPMRAVEPVPAPAPAKGAKAGKVEPAAVPPPPERKPLMVAVPKLLALGRGLERTRREGFVARLVEVFRRGVLDEALIAQVEEVLLTADVGVKTAGDLLTALRTEFHPETGDVVPQVLRFLEDRVYAMIADQPHGMPELRSADGPAVMMVVGVNGTGKTTNIGKMARLYSQQGRKVILAAGDTYRAAGSDQLVIWGERVGVPVVAGLPNADPASVLFDAAKRAREEGFDLLICDTAGRLHTNVNLVDELKKIHRVLGKAIPGAPHEVLLMLDATMGQNAVRQADIFRQAVQVSSIALAKLDGTAKGGVVLSIVRDMGLPIRFVGIGEGMDDLRPFDPREFAEALFEGD